MLPACARKVYVRLPKNCTEAPAHSAGSRAAVGGSPIRRMQAENSEKSTRVAPLPTINARTKRSARSDQRSPSFTLRPADHTFASFETTRAGGRRKFSGSSRARDQRAVRERAVQSLAAERHVQLAVRVHDFELAVLVELPVDRVQKLRLEAIHVDAFDLVNRSAAGFTLEQR